MTCIRMPLLSNQHSVHLHINPNECGMSLWDKNGNDWYEAVSIDVKRYGDWPITHHTGSMLGDDDIRHAWAYHVRNEWSWNIREILDFENRMHQMYLGIRVMLALHGDMDCKMEVTHYRSEEKWEQ